MGTACKSEPMVFTYTDDIMKMYQALWGTDFISPGGADATRHVIGNEDLSGKTILEVGSGWGGPSLLFAKDYKAGKVTGIDLQPKAVEKANMRAKDLGLSNVEFLHVDSLNWPFKDETFDIIFSKDALLHTPDKEAVYTEMKRVLKPGGKVLYMDWFGSDQEETPELKQWLQDNVTMVLRSLGYTADIFIRLGFTDIRLEDRCNYFRQMFEKDLETLKGPVGKELEKEIGHDSFAANYKIWFEPCAVLAEQGRLRLGTFYATKPLKGQ